MFTRIVLFLLLCNCLLSQENVFLSMGQWIDGKFVKGYMDSNGYNVFDFKKGFFYRQIVPYAPLPGGQEYPKDANRFTFNEETKQYDRPKRFITSISQSPIFFVNGEIYSVVKGGKPLISFQNIEPTGDGNTKSKENTQTKEIVPVMELLVFLNGEWNLEASLKTNSMGVILPLSNGNYLVGLRDGHSVDENKRELNPFGIYRKNNRGNLDLVRTIDLENYEIWRDEVSLMPTNIAITDGYYTFISNATGMIWTFSSNNGRLARSRTLYPDVLESLKSKKRIVPIITCAQPTNNGEILFSAWSSKLCIEGGKIVELINTTRRQLFSSSSKNEEEEEELKKNIDKMQNSIFELDPIVRWYKYDPATGQLTRKPIGPEGSKNIILSREEYVEYRDWFINEDGTEIFYMGNSKLAYLIPNEQNRLKKDGKVENTSVKGESKTNALATK